MIKQFRNPSGVRDWISRGRESHAGWRSEDREANDVRKLKRVMKWALLPVLQQSVSVPACA